MKSFSKQSQLKDRDGKKYWHIYVTDDNYDTYEAICAFIERPSDSDIKEIWEVKRSLFKLC